MMKMTAVEKRLFWAIAVVTCIVIGVAFVLFGVCSKAHGFDVTRFEVSAAFTPPHNEPIVGNKVARYKVEGDAGLRLWRFTLDGNAKVWFLQDWRTPEVVGHGIPDAWRGSDWGFDAARLDYNAKLGFDLVGGWQAFVEHNKWSHLAGIPPSVHANEYYWMTGFRYKLK